MIDIIREYWHNYLYTDGFNYTGLAITLWLLVVSLGIGFLLAIPLAVARVSLNPFISWPVRAYTYVLRGTPLYVQLLMCYTGLYSLEFVHSQPLLNSFFRHAMNCTLLAFAINESAYVAEIFAGAIAATAAGEIEAGMAFGMSRCTLYRRVILPSALRRALPAYSNEVILMLHATTLAFTATIPDILKVARDVNAATYQTFEAYGLAGLLYASLAFLLIWLFRRFEARWMAFLKPRSH